MNINDSLKSAGIVPVIVLDEVEKAEALGAALIAGGVNCAEVTFRVAGADQVISRLVKAYPDMLVGAGTVLTIEQLYAAKAAGAKFCVAPGLNPTVVKEALKIGMPFIPGVATPSEIECALELGLDTVKFFPAEQAGGINYIKAVSAAYTSLKFMPTGGVNAKNILNYIAYDKVLACGGSWIVAKNLLKESNWDEVTRLCKEVVAQIKEVRG